jgi:hypothetical protein
MRCTNLLLLVEYAPQSPAGIARDPPGSQDRVNLHLHHARRGAAQLGADERHDEGAWLDFAARGEVAQLVEHTAENRGVAGSIPALATPQYVAGVVPGQVLRRLHGKTWPLVEDYSNQT